MLSMVSDFVKPASCADYWYSNVGLGGSIAGSGIIARAETLLAVSWRDVGTSCCTLGKASHLLPPDALELSLFFLVHKLTTVFAAFGPMFLAQNLGLNLSALLNCTLAGVVAYCLISYHVRLRYSEVTEQQSLGIVKVPVDQLLGPVPSSRDSSLQSVAARCAA